MDFVSSFIPEPFLLSITYVLYLLSYPILPLVSFISLSPHNYQEMLKKTIQIH